MLIDNSLILDVGLTLTTTGSSTNYIDTIGAAGGNAQVSGINTIQGGYDAYEQLFWEVVVIAAMTAGGISLDCTLWTTNQAVSAIWTTGNGGSKPTSSVNTILLLDTGIILAAALTAKAVLIKARLPQGLQRYISGFYVCNGTFSGGGTITSVLVPDVDINLT